MHRIALRLHSAAIVHKKLVLMELLRDTDVLYSYMYILYCKNFLKTVTGLSTNRADSLI